jgi:hypothetical protein
VVISGRSLSVKWHRLLDNRTYCDADQQFIIEFMAGRYWLATAQVTGGNVSRSTPIGNYQTCRGARQAAENYAAEARHRSG